MDPLNPTAKNPTAKKKRRSKRKRNPPPLFNSDLPSLNSRSNPFDSLSNSRPFPGNIPAPPSVSLNTNEMLDRFNQLLDWRLLPGGDEPRHPHEGPRDYGVNDDRTFCSPREERDFSPPRQGKRRITDANDLRNRLDQQSKRWKDDIVHRVDFDERRLPEPFDRSRLGSRFDVDDRRQSTRFDIDYRSSTKLDVDDRRELRDRFGGRLNERWPELFQDDRSQQRIDVRGDRKVIDESGLQTRWNEHSDQYASRASHGVWATPKVEPVDYNHSNVRWVDDRNYSSRDNRLDDNRQDFGRQVKEYWPDRNPANFDSPFRKDDDYLRVSSNERDHHSGVGVNEVCDERRDNYFIQEDRNVRDGHNPHQRAIDKNDYYVREHELPSSIYNNLYQSSNTSRDLHDNYLPADSSLHRSRSPIRKSGSDRPSSPTSISSKDPTPASDLMVIIHKPHYARISYPEGDQIRSNLIDRVMNFGNPEQMPEFVKSGLMTGKRAFYVVCRTKESMDWLLEQSLPPVNNVEIIIRRNRIHDTIKISTFAPRCQRSREDIIKLIKLQNGKKGFNFDNWFMRSYQASPSGVYMAFDISHDEARLLKELGCKLSFELKALSFKISIPNSQYTQAPISIK